MPHLLLPLGGSQRRHDSSWRMCHGLLNDGSSGCAKYASKRPSPTVAPHLYQVFPGDGFLAPYISTREEGRKYFCHFHGSQLDECIAKSARTLRALAEVLVQQAVVTGLATPPATPSPPPVRRVTRPALDTVTSRVIQPSSIEEPLSPIPRQISRSTVAVIHPSPPPTPTRDSKRIEWTAQASSESQLSVVAGRLRSEEHRAKETHGQKATATDGVADAIVKQEKASHVEPPAKSILVRLAIEDAQVCRKSREDPAPDFERICSIIRATALGIASENHDEIVPARKSRKPSPKVRPSAPAESPPIAPQASPTTAGTRPKVRPKPKVEEPPWEPLYPPPSLEKVSTRARRPSDIFRTDSQTQAFLQRLPREIDLRELTALSMIARNGPTPSDKPGFLYLFWPKRVGGSGPALLDADHRTAERTFRLAQPHAPAPLLDGLPRVLFKIGKALQPRARVSTWAAKCREDYELVRQYPGGERPMPVHGLVEALVKAQLRPRNVVRSCEKCVNQVSGKPVQHREWFAVDVGEGAGGVRVLDGVIRTWMGWAEERYGEEAQEMPRARC